MKIEALVLAAGRGSRFGAVKLAHKINGKPVLRYTLDTLLAAEIPTTVVLGYAADTVRSVYQNLPVSDILNSNWEQGMGTTLACGVMHLMPNMPDAILVCLGDQIGITAQDINRMQQAANENPDCIVVADFGEQLSPPCLFPRRFFKQLEQLSGDEGARHILKRHIAECVRLSIPDAQYDIDCPADIERFLAR